MKAINQSIQPQICYKHKQKKFGARKFEHRKNYSAYDDEDAKHIICSLKTATFLLNE